jgi:superfamily II DNA or RNA helicase
VITLRPYQEEAVTAVLTKRDQYQKLLMVMPTGAGKTIVFSHIAHRIWQAAKEKTLILAHRDELIDQAIDKLQRATGLKASREQADSSGSKRSTVVVASVASLKTDRLTKWPRNYFGQIIVDECHHILADTYQRILDHFPDAKVLGVTATADRGDKRNLGTYFEEVACEIDLLSLIRDRYLSKIEAHTIPLKIDLRAVKTTANGDLCAEEVSHAIEPYLEKIADIIAAECAHRKTLVFLPLIWLSEQFAGICKNKGLAAEHVDGTSPDRADILDRFSTDQTRLLSNCMLLTEGYDEPSIDCVICLRPTKIRSLYAQMVGRGTRIHPGKTELLLIDFLWLSDEHALIKPAHLLASDNEEARAMASFGDRDLAEAKERAEAERLAAHEKLAARLAANQNKKRKTFNALEFCVALRNLALADYEPTMRWHSKPVSEKQAALLLKNGIDLATVKNAGHAHVLIETIMNRYDLRLASVRQLVYLRKLGHPPGAVHFRGSLGIFRPSLG